MTKREDLNHLFVTYFNLFYLLTMLNPVSLALLPLSINQNIIIALYKVLMLMRLYAIIIFTQEHKKR